jgi:hypothetical protein
MMLNMNNLGDMKSERNLGGEAGEGFGRWTDLEFGTKEKSPVPDPASVYPYMKPGFKIKNIYSWPDSPHFFKSKNGAVLND